MPSLADLRTRMTTDLYYRLSALALALLTVIICTPILVINTANPDYGASTFPMGMLYAGAVWSILYCGTILGINLNFVHQHPGIDIAFDFLGFALNIGMTILSFMYVGALWYIGDNCWGSEYPRQQRICVLAKATTGLQIVGSCFTLAVG
jgi:hypothetical protein